ncbi:MAG: TAXI family TRAP transporter solute-binding subunit [Deltaproteobacteria bacterium]|jgi:TRAP transporter TAXI family solute receptor|nr:TAXI family TRAP transporter solute-binding subunit [Deltaproteobacteria bacterium]
MKSHAVTALLIIVIALALPASTNAATERPWATIGTGTLTGVYYGSGHAIAKTLRRYAGDQKIDMSVKETEGSLENLEAVTSGQFYFGIVQSDIQYQAWHGTTASPWEGKPQKNLRAVFSLYTEAINLVALSRLDINTLKDLKSKHAKVNLGEPGSGQYINAKDLLMAVGIHPQDDVQEVHVSPPTALELFEGGDIDAFFFTAGHPAAQFHEVAGGKMLARFVTLDLEEKLLKDYPYYSRTFIPMKYYPGMDNKQDVATIGVKATVVASTDTPDWMVYGVVKAVVENMDYFKSQLLVFEGLNRAGMLEALSAPIHPGALKYYREAGLVQ